MNDLSSKLFKKLFMHKTISREKLLHFKKYKNIDL